MKKSAHQGFTLIELLLVITITALVSAATIPGYRGYIRKQNLKQSLEQVKSDLRTVQTKAMAESYADTGAKYWLVTFTASSTGPSKYIFSTATADLSPTPRGESEKLMGDTVIRNNIKIYFRIPDGNAFYYNSSGSLSPCGNNGENCNIIIGNSSGNCTVKAMVNSAGAILKDQDVICVFCSPIGDNCSSGSNCCTGICSGGKCADCFGLGDSCDSRGCCSGLSCNGGRCCTSTSGSCNLDSQCCSGKCLSHTCVDCIPNLSYPSSPFSCDPLVPCCDGASTCKNGKCFRCNNIGGFCGTVSDCCTGPNPVVCHSILNKCCTPISYHCNSNQECCTGKCSPVTHFCECISQNGTCFFDSDCCDGICYWSGGSSGICRKVCSNLGESCGDQTGQSMPCCDGLTCIDRVCSKQLPPTNCQAVGTPCGKDSYLCCSNKCVGGTCSCSGVGGTCVSNSDCCAGGSCSGNGSSYGICEANCIPIGQACGFSHNGEPQLPCCDGGKCKEGRCNVVGIN